MNFRAAALLLLLAPFAHGVSFRLATFNVGAHLVIPTDGGAAYFDYGIGAPGQPDHDKVRDVLARINADVVALEEIHSTDVSGSPDDVDALAASLGYSYSFISPTTNTFDTSLRVIFLSRYPFISTETIGSPAGAKEITRLCPAVKVDLPGTTKDPTLIAVHLKSGTTSEDRFRRAVEMKRVVGYIAAKGLTADDNFIILGDFNPSSTNRTFTALPTGLPSSFSLGADFNFPTVPITYSTNPLNYFTSPLPVKLDPRQLNNSASTFDTTTTTGPVLDLFLVSPAIAGRPYTQEIYNSTLDTSNSVGLPKSGSPPAADTSALASDHYAVFANLEMDQDYPNLAASLNVASTNEVTPSGSVSLTVTLPATRSSSVTISISSDDPTTLPAAATATLPAGSTSTTIPISSVRNFIPDDTRSVTFSVSASGYDPANALLQVIDADAPYIFTSAGQTIVENFTTFNGSRDPGQWTTSGAAWRGTDDGTSATSGFRTYGAAGDGSIGMLANGAPTTASATFTNQTGKVLTALQIAFTAEQWRSFNGGTADSLSAELVVNGIAQPVPALTFTAATNLPTGAIAGGTSTGKSAVVTGLSIPPGSTFDLRFSFKPGTGGGALPSGVFVNEFHYDNIGTDSGEFIEVVIGPGFTGSLSDIDVVLYNGENATSALVYSTFNLGSLLPVTYNGYRIVALDLPVNGLQNGPRDGIAVYNKTLSQLLHFVSYGGTFTPTTGPAANAVPSQVPVTESNTTTPANSSLGLGGTGSAAGNFTWSLSSGSNTKGAPNTGQTFVIPSQPQGIAFDDVSVTFLADTDGDGLVDLADPDDDNDGMTDSLEALTGSNPLDANSIYRAAISQPAPGSVTLTFATLSGRSYTVESSDNLVSWTPVTTRSGTGSPVSLPLPTADPRLFYRVAVRYE